jgi:hypothetical protein
MHKRSRLAPLGYFLVGLSMLSFLLGAGMPGVGWVVAGATLIAISALTPFIGRGYVIVAMGVSIMHLYTFGPLAGGPAPASASFIATFVAIPLVCAVVSVFVPRAK